MMNQLLTSTVAVGCMLLTACGGSFDRAESVDDLVESGFDPDEAECVIDRAVEEFGEDKLASYDDLTPEDEAAMTEIASACLLGN